MKQHQLVICLIVLFASLVTVESGRNSKNKPKLKTKALLKQIQTNLTNLAETVGQLEGERGNIHDRLEAVEATLHVLSETCCVEEEEPEVEEAQWVYRVTGFSSQYNDHSWSANQVIGPPNVYPSYGDLRNTWASKVIDANQFINLEFQEALYVTAIDIYETFHAGGVKAISGKDPGGAWVTLWSTDAVSVIGQARIFSPTLQKVGFPIKEIQILVDCSVSASWVEIDAVQMRGTRILPIV